MLSRVPIPGKRPDVGAGYNISRLSTYDADSDCQKQSLERHMWLVGKGVGYDEHKLLVFTDFKYRYCFIISKVRKP